jgi:hypothetical protein
LDAMSPRWRRKQGRVGRLLAVEQVVSSTEAVSRDVQARQD